jgi:uncharacterized protein (TIGR03083 family)
VTLSLSEVAAGYPADLASFVASIRGLSESDWATTTRCEGWVVASVAAHVAGTLDCVTAGRFEELSEPDHVEKQVAARAGRTNVELADEIVGQAELVTGLLAALDDDAWNGPGVPGISATLGDGVETLWFDLYVHTDDIRSALGQAPAPGPGLQACVNHLASVLATRGWGPATLALDGVEAVAVGAGGEKISGDPHQFVLAATGRLDPATLGLDASVNVYG